MVLLTTEGKCHKHILIYEQKHHSSSVWI